MTPKEKVIEQVRERVDAAAVNCKIGAVLSCWPYEIRQALERGELFCFKIKNEKACGNYSQDEAKIYYDEAGNAVDYSLPYCDPERILDFALTAGLVPYGSDPLSLMVGTGHEADGVVEWEAVEQGFNDLIYSAHKMNREFFPPDPIWVNLSNYEVFCLCRCDNSDCSANLGPVDLRPLPFLPVAK